jgi:hypothetical protein
VGAHLYAHIEAQFRGISTRDPRVWCSLWEGPSCALGRDSVAGAFGVQDGWDDDEPLLREGYLSPPEVLEHSVHEECPWRLDDPYWVRLVEGEEFSAIVREERWRSTDHPDAECGPELRAFATLVESLLTMGHGVRVWCWESQ